MAARLRRYPTVFAAAVIGAAVLSACDQPGEEPGEAAPGDPPPADRRDEPAPRPGVGEPDALGLSERRRRRLQELGLDDPEGEILGDMRRRTDLIPDTAVLGGTMYWVPEGSVILTDRWVLGTYEDGHVRGQAILEYAVAGPDSIEWELIEARIDP